MQTKGTGKIVFCECPRCEAKLKMFINYIGNNFICPKCKKDFDLDEALNLTVITK